MMLMGLLLFGLVIYLLFQNNSRSNPTVHPQSNLLEIAKIRLVKGEISMEEFESVKKVILSK